MKLALSLALIASLLLALPAYAAPAPGGDDDPAAAMLAQQIMVMANQMADGYVKSEAPEPYVAPEKPVQLKAHHRLVTLFRKLLTIEKREKARAEATQDRAHAQAVAQAQTQKDRADFGLQTAAAFARELGSSADKVTPAALAKLRISLLDSINEKRAADRGNNINAINDELDVLQIKLGIVNTLISLIPPTRVGDPDAPVIWPGGAGAGGA